MSDKIIYCRCLYSKIFPEENRNILQKILTSEKKNIYITDDLCAESAEKQPELISLIKQHNTTIIACHPRAVKWLLDAAGIEQNLVNSVKYINMMKQSISEIAETLGIKIPEKEREEIAKMTPPLLNHKEEGSEQLSNSEKIDALKNNQISERAWFPVIDYSKCTNCGACLDFCLFGVYEKREDGSIEVKTPFNCKDNCPACARICPHNAIIFPKYDKAPVNGDMDEYTKNAPHKTPIFALSGDELYKALSKRNKKSSKKLYK
jgi:NAD-dependent dihydropyrimidine dehydrogenase PreA subunit